MIPTDILTIRYPSLTLPTGLSIDIQPFLNGLVPGSAWPLLTLKDFHSLCKFHPSPTRSIVPTISPRSLHHWWSIPLPHSARNVWYHAWHKKILCRSHLHSQIPLAFPDPTCAVCSGDLDSQTHFLFDCPAKLAVWSSIWTTFFAFPVTSDSIHSCLYLLNFPPSKDTTLSSASIFGRTLLAIWQHHWLFVFDQVPFVPSATLSTAHILLNQLWNEIALDHGSI
ncbi:hypothetical protein PHYBLDRAFT_170264 [Phycomyces blakesleeanus NRRL 1555(-)]|uniref:Reverse transcriptase zinc-binding domain-containing protein n=1 Tax=Phycomyces blakesleeanus (strain ATCC 8743b / DSM 1359 / FGSC 10004 / NBRC 33097 / NRRL 1555) TaxID=763407 RepID=A0A162U1P2_PHYB8|nr:hypothetical protein PHYBLDRAFT_170264 [Phycomyces blakesleeanus NRRL 1555(-)]OAD71603.1 hypothetical protein PHYBLDRAFT_170264 [Phycomyces blakesleeanus NRRL 1555(-)]|eukprot:XP_018289643.1 hypothetical protein PHYBLDRAFT_170264 [Phycomyces blakesleeanus NRRL 1555(-)]